MRTLIILVCSLALACSAGAAQNDNKSKKQAQKSRQAQSTQRTATAAGPKKATPKHYQPASTATSYHKAKGRQGVNNQVYQSRPNVKTAKKSSQQVATQNVQPERYATKKTKQGQQGVNRQVSQSGSNVKKGKGFATNRRAEYAGWTICDRCNLFQEDKTMERQLSFCRRIPIER